MELSHCICCVSSDVFSFLVWVFDKAETYWDRWRHIEILTSLLQDAAPSKKKKKYTVSSEFKARRTNWAPIRHRFAPLKPKLNDSTCGLSVRQCQIVWVSFASSYFWYFCSYVLCYLRPGRKLTVADSNWKLIASLAWLELWRTHFPFLHTVRFATLL
jgi:hypothetical protein